MILQAIQILLLLVQTGGGAINGSVVDNTGGRPVEGAQVIITKLPTRTPQGRSQTEGLVRVPPTTTDRTGRFSFPNVDLGDYIVRIIAEGYGDGSFVGRTPASNGMPVSVTEKNRTLDVTFRLIGVEAGGRRAIRTTPDDAGDHSGDEGPCRTGWPFALTGSHMIPTCKYGLKRRNRITRVQDPRIAGRQRDGVRSIARDLKLKREVAIKILPEEFPREAERLLRFQREAEVVAQLQWRIAGVRTLRLRVHGPRLQ